MIACDFIHQYPSGFSVVFTRSWEGAAPGIVALLGRSGCGKTTVLRCLAGLLRPASGSIRVGGRMWFDSASGLCLPPQARQVGYMPQDHALFPHMTVAQNAAYGLWRLPPPEASRRVMDLLERLGIGDLAGRLPHQISGGQQQRAALARALARRPDLLLLDEPLSALDAPTREEVRRRLREDLRQAGVPALLVTHDRREAMELADQVVVMGDGRVLQAGPVEEVFYRPCSAAVAALVGVEMLFRGRVLESSDESCLVDVQGVRLAGPSVLAGTGSVLVTLRSEDLLLARQRDPFLSARNQLAGTVLSIEPSAGAFRVEVDAGLRLVALVTKAALEELALRTGDPVTAIFKARALNVVPV